jgi:integrase
MTPSGVYQVVHERARAAGLPAMRPHQLRHAFVTSWLAEGGNSSYSSEAQITSQRHMAALIQAGR